jgi:hypothetical protein
MTDMIMPRIEEDDVYGSQGTVRWTVVQRYEGLWRLVEQHNKLAQDGERPPDPRWAEIGVRVLRELSALYRLHVPPRAQEDEDTVLHGMPAAQVVLAQLEELELKARTASTGP